jgi:hypothetical protein
MCGMLLAFYSRTARRYSAPSGCVYRILDSAVLMMKAAEKRS